jgi:hypothetical protein
VQQALQSSHTVSIAPSTSGTEEPGDEPAQLHQIANKVEARLRRAQEETVQATQALAQAQKDMLEQRSNAEQEKLALQAKWEKEKATLQQDREQLLAEKLEVQEWVHRALRSVTLLEVQIEERVPQQVAQLEGVIQQLQQCIADLELRTVPETPQEIRDLREATARSAVDRLKSFSLEYKQLSSRSTQTYESLTESPELQALESQLQHAQQQADTLQAQLKALSPVERMKRFPEKCMTQQQVRTLQSKVMEVSQ